MSVLSKPKEKIQFNLRIDRDLHKQLKELAIQNDRPINYVVNEAIKNILKESAKA